jgi:hypothetical protein
MVEIWNSFARGALRSPASAFKKFTNRKVAVARIWETGDACRARER